MSAGITHLCSHHSECNMLPVALLSVVNCRLLLPDEDFRTDNKVRKLMMM